MDECRRIGDGWAEAVTAPMLAEFDLYEHEYEAARAALASALEAGRRFGDYRLDTRTLRDLGYALLGLERRSDARATFTNLLVLATRDGPRGTYAHESGAPSDGSGEVSASPVEAS